MTPELKLLTKMQFEKDCASTKMPTFAVPKTKFTDATANGLTKCVIAWIKLHGGQAERISNTGRMLDNRKIVTNVVGQQKMTGSTKWIKGSGTNGTADISATINGKSVKIEVKIGKDRQSDAQIQYQADIEAAGGVYLIVKDFATFVKDYQTLIQ